MRPGVAGADQARQRLVEVGERGRQTPDAELAGARCAGARARARPARRACVDRSSCHSSTTIAARLAKRSRQSARDSSSVRLSGVVTSAVGQPAILPRADRCRRVAGAHVDGPMRPQRLRGAGEREAGVGGERAQRRQPEHRQRRRSVGRAVGPRAAGRATPHRSCPCPLAHVRGPIRRARTRPTPLPGNRRARSPVCEPGARRRESVGRRRERRARFRVC